MPEQNIKEVTVHHSSVDYMLQPVTEQNLPELLKLYKSCEDFIALNANSKITPVMILSDLAYSRSSKGTFFGVFCLPDNELIGVLDLIPGGCEGIQEQAYLELLMLAPAYRRNGLGARILESAECLVRSAGSPVLLGDVQVNNPDGLRFWQRSGFEIIAGPSQQPDGTITFRIRKLLPNQSGG